MSFFVTAAPSATPTATPSAFTTTTATPTARAEMSAASEAPIVTAPPAVTTPAATVADTVFSIVLTATDAPAAAPIPTPCEAFVNASATPIACALMVEPSFAVTVTAPVVVTGAPEMLAETVFAIELTATEPLPANAKPALDPFASAPPTPMTSAVIVAVSSAIAETPPAPALTGTPVIAAVTVLPTVFVPMLPLPAKAALVSWLVASVSEIAIVTAVSVLWSVALTLTAPDDQTCIAPCTSASTVVWIVLTATAAARPNPTAPPPPLRVTPPAPAN